MKKREKIHYFVNATKLPIRISRNKTATVTKWLGEKNALLREKRPLLAGKNKTGFMKKKTLPLFSSERIETRRDQIVRRKTEAFFPLSLY